MTKPIRIIAGSFVGGDAMLDDQRLTYLAVIDRDTGQRVEIIMEDGAFLQLGQLISDFNEGRLRRRGPRD